MFPALATHGVPRILDVCDRCGNNLDGVDCGLCAGFFVSVVGRTDGERASVPAADGSDVSENHPGDGGMSDATVERFYRIVLISLCVAVVVAVLGGVGVWVVRANKPPPEPMNAVDVGFLRDMLDHHSQALVISNIYLDERPDSGVAPYAREVILFQQREIEWMQGWLAEEGYAVGEPDRTAMEWMGMGMPVAQMPGMQTQERLDELDAATGEDADRLFFQIMADHHLGGIRMGDHANVNGARQEIIDFAASVSRNQAIEIAEYQAAYERLGLG